MRIAVLMGALLLLLIVTLHARYRKRKGSRSGSVAIGSTKRAGPKSYIGNDDDTAEAMLEIWRKCFNTRQFNYAILGEHEKVLKLVEESIPEAINSRKYFPRRPMVIPKLMSAIRSDDSTTRELVDIISQDPVLTGNILQLANSTFYRVSKEPVETVARAVVLLGTDGLRSVIANSVMQPIFKVPEGYYDDFAPTIWDLAVRSAMAAQAWARSTKKCNGFSAHLGSLIQHMAYIVLFKLTADLYQRASGSLPRPEVFVRIFEQQANRVCKLIADEWQLADNVRQAFSEFELGLDVEALCPLATAMHLGRIAGLGSFMHQIGKFDDNQVLALIEHHGVPSIHAEMMWCPDAEMPSYEDEM